MSQPSFAEGDHDGGHPGTPGWQRRDEGGSTEGSGERVAIEYPFFLEHARDLAREHPEHLAALEMSAEEYARSMTGPSMTIEESVAAGWMSAAEGRSIRGQATLADLLELGHSLDEARVILADQQERACASST
jgi:hypothetical protein